MVIIENSFSTYCTLRILYERIYKLVLYCRSVDVDQLYAQQIHRTLPTEHIYLTVVIHPTGNRSSNQ